MAGDRRGGSTPWWAIAIIVLFSAAEPLTHAWIADWPGIDESPGNGRAPTGLHMRDSAIYVQSMRMFESGFFSPYATCRAEDGAHSSRYFPAPFHWMYGTAGAIGRLLGMRRIHDPRHR